MPTLTWPMTVVLVTVIMVAGALAAVHVISADWIERTLSAIIGFLLGHALGILRTRKSDSLRPPPPSSETT